MIEVYENLFVGNQDDYEFQVKNSADWAIVHACKEPYHRDLLDYSGRGAPKAHPEYLIARRDNRLFLNLIDADSSRFIPEAILNTAVEFVSEHLAANRAVLVHCNQGRSRGPSIAMLYLHRHTNRLPAIFDTAVPAFTELYPPFAPARGIRNKLREVW